ncbi:EF-hand calcium-binding domain-containing protein 4B [Trichomycterus rosablanca]|uniref:EF-hand calcium-binding domain-containing protein 4B n=1 Tax=Trichomycterus rosablanca TaxID=2290929 RepID=UPI002F35C2B7
MSEHCSAMKVVSEISGSENNQSEPQLIKRLDVRRSSSASASLLEKTQEFFQICDSEGKGYITPTDMRKLDKELPLSAEELDDVFDSLDSDKNGYLTLEEFTLGLSDFLYSRKISQVEDQITVLSPKVSEALYQVEPQDCEEQRHFGMLMESLGAIDVFEDPSEVRSLWAQLKKDEPHLLYNFEDFLAQVTSQIRVAQQEKKEMENALRKKAATHHNEIQWLYEEMEQHIIYEENQHTVKELHSQMSNKEQELEQLFLKQKRLEHQCQELQTEHQESQVENIKLKKKNQDLSHELQHTCHELSLAQEQLTTIQDQASRLQQEKDMEVYRITERLQREKENLIKQLDMLRDMNKNLRDEQDLNSSKDSSLLEMSSHKQGQASALMDHPDFNQATQSKAFTEEIQQPYRKPYPLANGHGPHSATKADDKWRVLEPLDKGSVAVSSKLKVLDDPPDGWPFRRIISIEEDHLPHLLQGDPCPFLHQLIEEEKEEEEVKIDLQMSPMNLSNMPKMSLARGQTVDKRTIQKAPAESAISDPQRLFKVILVGNSSVGKTAFLHRFCDGHFNSTTTATVGIDYSVRILDLWDSKVVLQLWDTAGQERYRSITKQFFRKADGVVVIYDITVNSSFRAVQHWLASIQETVEDSTPIMLLGNKSDRESEREVSVKEAERLAKETCLLFYECSAYTGHNVLEAMVQLARVLKEQEDRTWEKTVRLVDQTVKKKTCCN